MSKKADKKVSKNKEVTTAPAPKEEFIYFTEQVFSYLSYSTERLLSIIYNLLPSKEDTNVELKVEVYPEDEKKTKWVYVLCNAENPEQVAYKSNYTLSDDRPEQMKINTILISELLLISEFSKSVPLGIKEVTKEDIK